MARDYDLSLYHFPNHWSSSVINRWLLIKLKLWSTYVFISLIMSAVHEGYGLGWALPPRKWKCHKWKISFESSFESWTALLLIIIFKEIIFKSFQLKANVNHIILAVSYRAEMLEQEIKAKEKEVSIHYLSSY